MNSEPIDHALARFHAALGAPLRLARINRAGRTVAAVGRWRHDGSRVELSDIAAIRLVFSITGGQELEWRRGDRTTKATARCGAVAIATEWDSDFLEVRGQGDTLQILIDPLAPGEARPDTAFPTSRLEEALCLRALSAQALVALAEYSDRSIPQIVQTAGALMSRASSPSPPVARGGLSPGVLRRVQALVDGQLEREPDRLASVADLADMSGLSLSHFIRAFRASEGTTPHRWIMARRLEEAIAQLLRDRTSVTETAICSGFSSAAHFVASFRRNLGVTPAQFRDASRA